MKDIKMLKRKFKIALIVDDYKIPMKENLWANALVGVENIQAYSLVKEKKKPGPYGDTTSFIRYYELLVQ